MKKIIFLLAAILTIGNVAYAGFPVTTNDTQTEVTITPTDELVETPVLAPPMKWGGFFLGFLLGIIGVLIAYLTSDDKDFIRSTWKGFGVYALLYLLLIAAMAG